MLEQKFMEILGIFFCNPQPASASITTILLTGYTYISRHTFCEFFSLYFVGFKYLIFNLVSEYMAAKVEPTSFSNFADNSRIFGERLQLLATYIV